VSHQSCGRTPAPGAPSRVVPLLRAPSRIRPAAPQRPAVRRGPKAVAGARLGPGEPAAGRVRSTRLTTRGSGSGGHVKFTMSSASPPGAPAVRR